MAERVGQALWTVCASVIVALIVSGSSVLYTMHGIWKDERRYELRLAEQDAKSLAAHLAFCLQVSAWAEKYQRQFDTNVPEVSNSCREVEVKVFSQPISFLTKRDVQ